MRVDYLYYDLEGVPCRVAVEDGHETRAEIYKRGVGFIPGPKMEISFQGVPITKEECDRLIFEGRQRRADTSQET